MVSWRCAWGGASETPLFAPSELDNQLRSTDPVQPPQAPAEQRSRQLVPAGSGPGAIVGTSCPRIWAAESADEVAGAWQTGSGELLAQGLAWGTRLDQLDRRPMPRIRGAMRSCPSTLSRANRLCMPQETGATKDMTASSCEQH